MKLDVTTETLHKVASNVLKKLMPSRLSKMDIFNICFKTVRIILIVE
jgi:hypothetical protein